MKIGKFIQKIKLTTAFISMILIIGSVVIAQEKIAITLGSNRKARAVLDAAIEATGGLENLRKADKITIHYRGVGHPTGQNEAFTAPPINVPRTGARTMIDYGGGRYVSEGESGFPGGYKFNFRTVISPKRSFNIDVLKNRRGNTIQNLAPPQQAGIKVGMLTEVPHLLLLFVLTRSESLRFLGETDLSGRKYRVISYATETGGQISLYFDSRTKLLARSEQINSSAQLGDAVSATVFSDYQTIGNIRIPKKSTAFFAGKVNNENEYAEVKLDFAEGESLLDVPAGYVETTPSATANAEPARKMGEGVYLIEQFGYGVMFVEFRDYVIIFEPPLSADVSKGVIKIVKQTVPDKPIRYVSFSHFHFDHTGGLREYIAEGATIVVPPGNRSFVEEISKSKFTLRPDTLALKPRTPIIETFDKKRIFTDGVNTVELHNIGPVSHVADMTIFYFPKEKVLFQGDMFSKLETGEIPPIIEINHELIRKADELRLDVEMLIGVHAGAVSWKDFRAAVSAK